MNNENKTTEKGNGIDISPEALKDGGTKTVVKPKVNLSPNSQHEYSDLETVPEEKQNIPNAADVSESPNAENLDPEKQPNTKEQSQESNNEELQDSQNQGQINQQTSQSEENNSQEEPMATQNAVMPPKNTAGNAGNNGKPPRPKNKKGMSDNMKYILIGIAVVILVAGAVVAWNLLNSDNTAEEDPASQDPVVEEPQEPADVEGPEVTLTSPSQNDVVSETFTIEGTLQDKSEIVSLTLYMNDSMAEEIENPSDDFSIEVDSLNFANGTYTLYVIAVDSEGNETQSEEVTIEVTNTAPEPTEEPQEPEDSEEPEEDNPTELPKTGAGWY